MRRQIKTLGIHEQKAWFKTVFPRFSCLIAESTLVCSGELQPTPLGSAYRVQIQYRGGHNPKAFIRDGQLQRRSAEEQIPHTYSEEQPCLFFPRGNEWRSDLVLAKSFVCWLVEWLHFYEIWRATGEWMGGGIDHGSGAKS